MAAISRILDNAEKFPQNPVLVYRGETITYDQFYARIRCIAYQVKAARIGKGDMVPAFLERGIDAVAAILRLTPDETLSPAISGLSNR